MVDLLKINSAHFTWRLVLLKDLLSFLQNRHDFFLVFQAFHVFMTVSITAFEHFIEFFIETFANTEEAATDPKIEKNKLQLSPLKISRRQIKEKFQDVSVFHRKSKICSKLQDIIYHHYIFFQIEIVKVCSNYRSRFNLTNFLTTKKSTLNTREKLWKCYG